MNNNEDIKNLVEHLKKSGAHLTDEQIEELAKQLQKDFSYVPKVGVFGKTGAGKSSLVNAIFGQDICPVSDVEACTRKIQEANIGGFILIDCPGIAESKEKDAEYHKLYADLIPTLDAIIWVLQGDNRSYGPDLECYDLIKDCFKNEDGSNRPLFFALNQVDKIEPFREWSVDDCMPGPRQEQNIKNKITNVASLFGVSSHIVIPVSAVERYNLSALISAILYDLPENQALIMSAKIDEKLKQVEKEKEEELERLRREREESDRKQKEEIERLRKESEEKARELEEKLAEERRAQEERERKERERVAKEKEEQDKRERELKEKYERNLGEKIGAGIETIGRAIGGSLGKGIEKAGKVVGWLSKLFK